MNNSVMTITYADRYDLSFKLIDTRHQYPHGIDDTSNSNSSSSSSSVYIVGLYISARGLKDRSLIPLTRCIDLTCLLIPINDINDISFIHSLCNLEQLNISYNRIKDASPLKSLINLRRVDMQNNDVENISFVRDLQYLKYLDVGLNCIVDLSPLRGNTSLKKLYLTHNRIIDVSPLRQTNIRELYISSNSISDISPLNDIPSLHTIFIRNNRITTISPLRYNETILYLNLEGNDIEDRSVVFTMSNIETFQSSHCYNMQISDHMMTNIANGITRRMTYHQILVDRTMKRKEEDTRIIELT